jgi:hypothetical protein
MYNVYENVPHRLADILNRRLFFSSITRANNFNQPNIRIYSLSRRKESRKHKLFACLYVRTSLIGQKNIVRI